MKVEVSLSRGITKINVNDYRPLMKMNFNGKKIDPKSLRMREERINIDETNEGIILSKDLGVKEHVIGLGEKAFGTERRRTRTVMYNTDSFGYGYGTDPLYVSIPFFISVRGGLPSGLLINNASSIVFDIGVEDYGKIKIEIPENGSEFYIIDGKTIEEIVEKLSSLTGKPFKIPGWALGHMISRYSYFPGEKIIKVVDEYRKFLPVEAVFLDIDYMDRYKNFTWSESFGKPEKLLKEMHKRNVKVITIVDPSIPVNQKYGPFVRGLGNYCNDENENIYVDSMWPGRCAFPDFLNQKARAWWSDEIKRWTKKYRIDGIWLDMNEPTRLVDEKGAPLDPDAIHTKDDGTRVKHSLVHNAYPLLEAKATYDAGVKFILSRSGFIGIQRYAAIWSGDNVSSWEDMRLQIPLLTGLSISGIPYVGCDIGGFSGHSDAELIARYYQMAAFFPIMRNHKIKGGNDQEIYALPDKFKGMIQRAVRMRYAFMPYLKELAEEAHRKGHPMIRPLCYEFQGDEDTYLIDDEYMVGKDVLYAPIVEKGRTSRDVYLPKGKWYDPWKKESMEGGKWITSNNEMPLFIRSLKGKERILEALSEIRLDSNS
ncbi:MAG: alpha-glucosidase MalA [Nanoarchaeota archaeon]|nr:alpha-glucosidase MalA [Nanoarchaeota archaeon]